MMALVWILLALGFLFGWFGRREIALAFIALCFAVAVKLFLWEIHSSTYGYRMPWIQTRSMDKPPVSHPLLTTQAAVRIGDRA